MLTQKQFLEKTAKVLCDAGNWAEEHLSDNTTKGAGLSWYLDVLAAEAQCQAYLSGIEEKPTYAHWGPSQSGKSSCLSVELDRKTKTDGTAVGANSALHFDECSRMGWIIPNELEHSFNPPGGGSDGTACVTRFTAKTPENLNFPIRLTFATTDNFRLTSMR